MTLTTPFVLRITRLPVGRRASGFVQVAKGGEMIERAAESIATTAFRATNTLRSAAKLHRLRRLRPLHLIVGRLYFD